MTTNAMTETTPPTKAPTTLKGMLADVKVKSRFEEILGKKASGFISSVISVYQTNRALQEVDPNSIIASAAIAASLDLPINQSLGQAAIVPYKGLAQFQIMSKGFIQLAQRTGQYIAMNATEVYEGQLLGHDTITGEVKFDSAKKTSDRIIGYVFYFKLKSGFEHYEYMTVEAIQAHGKKFSKSYENPKGLWKSDFHAMALKTVVKRGLSKWGPLSTEMQRAVETDQSVIKDDGTPEYIDSTAERGGTEGTAAAPEMPKPAEPGAATSDGPTVVSLAAGTFSVGKGAKVGARVTAKDGKVYTTDNEDVAKLLLAAPGASHGVKLTVWPGLTENEIESAEIIKG